MNISKKRTETKLYIFQGPFNSSYKIFRGTDIKLEIVKNLFFAILLIFECIFKGEGVKIRKKGIETKLYNFQGPFTSLPIKFFVQLILSA